MSRNLKILCPFFIHILRQIWELFPTIPIEISIKPRITENIHIGASFSIEEIDLYKALFQEFWDIFSWSYEEMPSIDPKIVI